MPGFAELGICFDGAAITGKAGQVLERGCAVLGQPQMLKSPMRSVVISARRWK